MINASYIGYSVIKAYGLTQYDYGQILQIDGLLIDDGTEIHFCQNEKAITQYMQNNQVQVPDYMMQYPDEINAYVYRVDSVSGETLQKVVLNIMPRERPGDYVAPEEPAYSRLLPPGGAPGQILTRGPTGYEWIDPMQEKEATELEVIEMMEKLFGGEEL